MKMKMRSRLIAGLLGLMMLLSACSSGTSNTATDSKATEKTTEKTTEETTETSVAADTAQTQDTTDVEKITIWVHANSFKTRAEDYAAATGNEVEVVLIPYDDFQTKLKQSITDPKTTPDLFIISRDFAREWVEAGSAITNLSKAFPDDMATYEANTYASLLAMGSNDDGDVYGVTAEYSLGMMFYNREVAEKLLGTQDEAEVAKAISSEEKILELNELLKAEYGGDVKMFGTFYNIASFYFNSRVEPWVKDDVMTITDEIDHFMDWAKIVYDNDMILAEGEDDAYFNGYAEGNFMLDPLPTWGFNSKVRPQVVDDGIEIWGVTSPYIPYIRGGSFFFIPEASANKEAAWEAVKYMGLDEDNLYSYCLSALSLAANKSVNEKLVDNDYKEPLLGGQAIFKTYLAATADVEAKYGDSTNTTKYDGFIAEFLRDVAKDYATGKVTKEEAYKDFKLRLESAYPEITVEW